MDFSKYNYKMNFSDYTIRNLALILATFAITLLVSSSLKNHSYDIITAAITPSKDALGLALDKASTANKTLIIVIVNRAYMDGSIFDLFLESFWAGEGTRPLVDHLLVVAMDRAAHERCRFRRLNCYRMEDGEDFAGEKFYMSAGFIEMMWRRTRFLLDVLNRGFNFVFSDTDVLWLRNPLPKLIGAGEATDMQISTDAFNGDSFSERNPINTGFYFVRSNEKTISLFQTWYEMRKNATGMKEQDVLANMVRNGAFGKFGVKVKFLDTLYFSGFCQESRDIKQVTTVHANCCRGIRAKVEDLNVVLGDWKVGKNRNSSDFGWSKHTSCRRSWH